MRAAGTVPEPKLAAFRAVRFAPETVGSVAGKRPSGRVPVAKSDALRVARSASEEPVLLTDAHVIVAAALTVIVSGISASTSARKVGAASAPALGPAQTRLAPCVARSKVSVPAPTTGLPLTEKIAGADSPTEV